MKSAKGWADCLPICEHWGTDSLTRLVEAIRADPRLQRDIAADFGVSQAQVSDIKTRRSWAHLPAAVLS